MPWRAIWLTRFRPHHFLNLPQYDRPAWITTRQRALHLLLALKCNTDRAARRERRRRYSNRLPPVYETGLRATSSQQASTSTHFINICYESQPVNEIASLTSNCVKKRPLELILDTNSESRDSWQLAADMQIAPTSLDLAGVSLDGADGYGWAVIAQSSKLPGVE